MAHTTAARPSVHPVLDKLASNGADPPAQLRGYIGRAGDSKSLRLHLTLRGTTFVDISDDDVIAITEPTDDGEAVLVHVRSSATVVATHSERVKAGDFERLANHAAPGTSFRIIVNPVDPTPWRIKGGVVIGDRDVFGSLGEFDAFATLISFERENGPIAPALH